MKKKIIQLVLCAVVICFAVIGVKSLFGGIDLNVEEEMSLTSSTIAQILEPASELVTLKYNYEQFDTYEKSKKIILKKQKVDMPFTTDQIVFTYGGCIALGVDLSEIEFDIDIENKLISCKLPEVEVISHETDETKFQEFEIKNSIFTKTTWTDFNKISAELKQNQEEKVLKDETVIEAVNENAQEVISRFLKSAKETQEYEVEFI